SRLNYIKSRPMNRTLNTAQVRRFGSSSKLNLFGKSEFSSGLVQSPRTYSSSMELKKKDIFCITCSSIITLFNYYDQLKRYIKLCMYDNSTLQLTKMNSLSASSNVTEGSKSEITEFDNPNSLNINISGKRSFQSEVWDYFDKFEWTKEKKTAKCMVSKCLHKPFSCGTTDTTKPYVYVTMEAYHKKRQNAHQTQFPCLVRMACNYLAIQGSSVVFECAFSVGGNMTADMRSCLVPKTLRASSCLQS
ncbi:hypothetical protein G9A89_019418, partial [Geosiphon pyriformis]